MDWTLVTEATQSVFAQDATVTIGDESFSVRGIYSDQGRIIDREMRLRTDYGDDLDVPIFSAYFTIHRSTIPEGIYIESGNLLTIGGENYTIEKVELAAAGDVRCWIG